MHYFCVDFSNGIYRYKIIIKVNKISEKIGCEQIVTERLMALDGSLTLSIGLNSTVIFGLFVILGTPPCGEGNFVE